MTVQYWPSCLSLFTSYVYWRSRPYPPLADWHVRRGRRAAERLDHTVQRVASGYTKAYLKAVASSTRYLEERGFKTSREYTLSSDEAYVSLALNTRPLHRLERSALWVPDTADTGS